MKLIAVLPVEGDTGSNHTSTMYVGKDVQIFILVMRKNIAGAL